MFLSVPPRNMSELIFSAYMFCLFIEKSLKVRFKVKRTCTLKNLLIVRFFQGVELHIMIMPIDKKQKPDIKYYYSSFTL